MKQYFFALLVMSRMLGAQPSGTQSATVAPGMQSDVAVNVNSPGRGDMIDVLVSNLTGGASVDIFLPDGRAITSDNAEQNGLSLDGVLQADLGSLDASTRKGLVSGPGDHLILFFSDKPQGGSYRIRVDNRKGTTPVRVAAAFVGAASIVIDSFRSIPGVVLAGTVKVPPGSTGVRLSFLLARSTEDAVIDVASTDDGIAIRLRLPDGTVITKENAKANGLEWLPMRYPPDSSVVGDDLGAPIAAAFVMATMLPVDGMHYGIHFPSGIRQAGTYTVEADGRQNTSTAEVSAMFVPLEKASSRWRMDFSALHPLQEVSRYRLKVTDENDEHGKRNCRLVPPRPYQTDSGIGGFSR